MPIDEWLGKMGWKCRTNDELKSHARKFSTVSKVLDMGICTKINALHIPAVHNIIWFAIGDDFSEIQNHKALCH